RQLQAGVFQPLQHLYVPLPLLDALAQRSQSTPFQLPLGHLQDRQRLVPLLLLLEELGAVQARLDRSRDGGPLLLLPPQQAAAQQHQHQQQRRRRPDQRLVPPCPLPRPLRQRRPPRPDGLVLDEALQVVGQLLGRGITL